MSQWLKLGLLVLAAVVVTQLFVRPPATTLKHGASAPPLALSDLGGREFRLDDLKGRVVLVNFWATWCPPCRAELPELAELFQEQKGRCFDLLGVAEQSPIDELTHASRSIPYPILLDRSGEVALAWDVVGFPSSFVVDTQGTVVRVFQGAVRKEQVLEAIGPLLPASCKGT